MTDIDLGPTRSGEVSDLSVGVFNNKFGYQNLTGGINYGIELPLSKFIEENNEIIKDSEKSGEPDDKIKKRKLRLLFLNICDQSPYLQTLFKLYTAGLNGGGSALREPDSNVRFGGQYINQNFIITCAGGNIITLFSHLLQNMIDCFNYTLYEINSLIATSRGEEFINPFDVLKFKQNWEIGLPEYKAIYNPSDDQQSLLILKIYDIILKNSSDPIIIKKFNDNFQLLLVENQILLDSFDLKDNEDDSPRIESYYNPNVSIWIEICKFFVTNLIQLYKDKEELPVQDRQFSYFEVLLNISKNSKISDFDFKIGLNLSPSYRLPYNYPYITSSNLNIIDGFSIEYPQDTNRIKLDEKDLLSLLDQSNQIFVFLKINQDINKQPSFIFDSNYYVDFYNYKIIFHLACTLYSCLNIINELQLSIPTELQVYLPDLLKYFQEGVIFLNPILIEFNGLKLDYKDAIIIYTVKSILYLSYEEYISKINENNLKILFDNISKNNLIKSIDLFLQSSLENPETNSGFLLLRAKSLINCFDKVEKPKQISQSKAVKILRDGCSQSTPVLSPDDIKYILKLYPQTVQQSDLEKLNYLPDDNPCKQYLEYLKRKKDIIGKSTNENIKSIINFFKDGDIDQPSGLETTANLLGPSINSTSSAIKYIYTICFNLNQFIELYENNRLQSTPSLYKRPYKGGGPDATIKKRDRKKQPPRRPPRQTAPPTPPQSVAIDDSDDDDFELTEDLFDTPPIEPITNYFYSLSEFKNIDTLLYGYGPNKYFLVKLVTDTILYLINNPQLYTEAILDKLLERINFENPNEICSMPTTEFIVAPIDSEFLNLKGRTNPSFIISQIIKSLEFKTLKKDGHSPGKYTGLPDGLRITINAIQTNKYAGPAFGTSGPIVPAQAAIYDSQTANKLDNFLINKIKDVSLSEDKKPNVIRKILTKDGPILTDEDIAAVDGYSGPELSDEDLAEFESLSDGGNKKKPKKKTKKRRRKNRVTKNKKNIKKNRETKNKKFKNKKRKIKFTKKNYKI